VTPGGRPIGREVDHAQSTPPVRHDRPPVPYDAAAEKYVLAALVAGPDLAPGDVDPADYYLPAHRRIAEALLVLARDGRPVRRSVWRTRYGRMVLGCELPGLGRALAAVGSPDVTGDLAVAAEVMVCDPGGAVHRRGAPRRRAAVPRRPCGRPRSSTSPDGGAGRRVRRAGRGGDAMTRRLKAVPTGPLGGAPPEKLPPPGEPAKVAAELVKARYRKPAGLVLRRWRGGWWSWKRSHWSEVEEPALSKALYDFTGTATYRHKTKDGYEERPWAPTRYKVADLAHALRAATHLGEDIHPPAWIEPGRSNPLPPARELVATTNGLLHVATKKLYDHTPRFFNQVAVPFDYDPDAPPPGRWLEFLKELWPDDSEPVAALQEFFGYVISGRTDLHKILLLVGPTRAGKGVIARVLKALVGTGNHVGPTLASLATGFGLAPLIGKPLAVVADARLGGRDVNQVVERLLSISGEDALTIDRKYRDQWTGTLPTRFVILTNELPRFGDSSGAIANRFLVLALTESFLGRENPGLTNELLAELPGILNWSLDGLAALHDAGRFTEPKASRDAIVALQDLVSPVAAFVRDECLVDSSAEVPVDELYGRWKVWAETNGHRVSTAQTFGRDLRAVIPGLRVQQPREGEKRVRIYVGVTLAPIGDPAPDPSVEAGDNARTHNGADRVPPRANPDAARGGTRSNPLLAGTENGTAGPAGNGALPPEPRRADYPDGLAFARARAEHTRRRLAKGTQP